MGEKMRIGVVDDHPWFRKILVEIIRHHIPQCTVSLQAGNGRELISTLSSGEYELPELILLDLQMPFMNGYETMEYLMTNYPQIKVMVFTLDQKEPPAWIVQKTNVVGWIYKNIEAPTLIEIIHSFHHARS
jgi:DNA-binding NarL/FixJ family response regulator